MYFLNYSPNALYCINLGCNTTCKGNFCDDSTNCTDGCRNGYWGPACSLQCPDNCKNCDSKTGQCTTCKSGFWDNTCNSQCPMDCFERVCVKSNGNCKKGCTSGQYGDTCNNTCSTGCVGGTCDQPALLDVNKTGQGVSVMASTPKKLLIYFNHKYVT